MYGRECVRQAPGNPEPYAGYNEDQLLAGLVEIIQRRIRVLGLSDAEMAKATQISRSTINRYRHGDHKAPGVGWRNIWTLMAYLQVDAFGAVMAVMCLENPETYHDPSYRNISHCASYLVKSLNRIVADNASGTYRSALAQISPAAVEKLAGFTINHVEARLAKLPSADEHLVSAA